MFPFLLARTGLLLWALWRRLGGLHRVPRDGSGTLSLAGLKGDVWICRDEFGVPQIHAEVAGDLAFGLGVAMAQDRLWQMESLRSLAGGRLAELVGDHPLGGTSLHLPGPTVLAVDTLYRSLRMHAVGREERSLLSAEAEVVMAGFAAGVNAWTSSRRLRDLPPEFLLAGIRPEPWTPEDSLAVGKLIGWLLSLAFLAKPILAALHGAPRLRSLLPPDLAHGTCVLGDGRGPFPEARDLDLLARRALGIAGPGGGSNGWVLGGLRTASGKPILCNDPHLFLGLPGFWYPIALHGPTHRVIGVTIPGIPAVLIGRNEHLAWGFTAVMADDGDYYRETLDGARSRYLRHGVWHPVEVAEEEFRVRGRGHAIRRAIRHVRHDDVLCPLLPQRNGEAPTSYRWVGLQPWRGMDAVLGMNRARTVEEFEAAVQHFALPPMNVVVADTAGSIAYFCAGKFPRRSSTGDGTILLDGASSDHAWRGYLTWEELPRSVNPRESFLATANNRIAVDLPPAVAAGFWEPAYRAARIALVLARSRGACREDMVRLQTDVLSLQAAGILAHLVRPAARAFRDRGARQAAALLSDWDCQVTAESAAAAIYHLFYQTLLRHCFMPLLDEEAPGLFARYFSAIHLAVPAVDAALLSGDGDWFPGGMHQTVEKCLAEAWEQATVQMGADPAQWRWGSLHRLVLHHSLGRGRSRVARMLVWLLQLNRGPYPLAGDGMTVNLGAFPLTEPFGVVIGPSYRQIVDLADPQESGWIIPGGASGDPGSPHYADQVELWLNGKYRPMRLRPLAEAKHAAALHLVPQA